MPEILIVDDSISVRRALEITLRNHAMQSRSTVSGEEAMELLHSGTYQCDALLVDVIMPGMSGIDVCRAVKTDGRYGGLPVILMSGNVDDEIRSQAREVGADGVLRKPFRSEELMPLVEGVLARAADVPAPATLQEAASEVPAGTPDTAPDDVAPAGAERIQDDHLDALNDVLQRYEDHPRMLDAVILDREGRPIRQTGTRLPEHITTFARFFTNTAGVLGQQMLGEAIQDVTIRYGAHEMVIHCLPGHGVIVLLGDGAHALKA